MLVIKNEVAVVKNLEVKNFVILKVLLLYFLGDNNQSGIVELFDHDPHLVEYELQLFALIHGSVGFNLNLLKDG